MKRKLSNVILLLFMQLFNLPIFGQCIELVQYPSSTIIVNSSNPTPISGCNYAGDYAVLNFTSTGTYSFTAIGGGGNYITLTDGANNPLYFGYAPLTVSISTTGIYKVHFSLDASCGDENTCRSTQINPGGTLTGTCINTFQYPSSTVTIMTNTPTSISSCNFAGDYAVLDFPTAGTYTLVSTGGSGNYITFTDTSNNPIATGNSPLVINISTPGIYYMHISLDIYCTTDNICHTTYIQPFGWTPPPAPTNDDCANAIPLTVPGTYTGTTIGATSEPTTVPTCTNTGLSQHGVWYTVVGDGSTYKASLCGTSGWDSKIFVYAGNNCSSLFSIGCNDDNGPDCTGTPASIAWCTTPGTTYYILVTGYSSPSDFTLTLNSFTPTLSYSISPSTLCAGSSASITSVVTPTDNSTWSVTITSPSGTNYTTNPTVITPTSTANYTLTAVNNKYFGSCAVISYTFYINVVPNPSLNVNITDATAPGCSNGSATVNVIGTPPYTYTWMPNVSSTSVATNLNGTSGGTNYTVVVTDANGCNSSVTFSVGCITGISSLNNNPNGVIIIPNPNNGIFNIQHELKGNVMFEIFDISGRKMQEFISESSNVPVNISELARGMYIIRMHNEAVKVEVPVIKE
jgi:hypothetical protein